MPAIRTLLALLALILPFPAHSGAADAPPRSRILLIDPPLLDLGTVEGRAPIETMLLLRNLSEAPAAIARLSSSCGCTELRAEAMVLPPGGFTPLHVTIDPFAKQGMVRKQITAYDSEGGVARATILLRVRNPEHSGMEGRSIFQGKCGRCHAQPAAGLRAGAAIYRAVCSMCHGANGSGGYAPPIAGLPRSVLLQTLRHGTGSAAMPPFARSHGGPLTDGQIRALVRWLHRRPARTAISLEK